VKEFTRFFDCLGAWIESYPLGGNTILVLLYSHQRTERNGTLGGNIWDLSDDTLNTTYTID
jgi:hypothetical protein